MTIDEYRALKNEPVVEDKTKTTPEVEEKDKIKETKPEQNSTPADVVDTEIKEPKEAEIDLSGFGEGVTAEDVLKWKQGYMTAEDYAQKVSDLNKKENEVGSAIEAYAKLKNNPEIASKLDVQNLSPVEQAIHQSNQKIADLELKVEIQELASKHKDFDIVKVLEYAQGKAISLEDAYKVTRDTNTNTKDIDIEALKAQIRSEVEADIKKDKTATQTLIGTNGGSAEVKAPEQPKFTKQEVKVMKAFNMTPMEYDKWRAKK